MKIDFNRRGGHRGRILAAALTALALGASPAPADFLPTHGPLGPHLDPFIDGWPVPPVFPPPPPGVVAPGDGALPDPEYDVVAPFGFDVLPGVDTAVSPGGWVWEAELDLDPYGGLPPVVPVTFDFTAVGGGLIGPVPVPLVPGPDIYLDVHQDDKPFVGADDVGPFFKALLNLTPIHIAWGTSVTEDPGVLLPPGAVEKFIDFFGDTTGTLGPIPVVEFGAFGFNGWEISGDPGAGFVIAQRSFVPEPTAGVIAAAVVACGALRRRRGR